MVREEIVIKDRETGQERLTIRHMTEEDLGEVLAIERASFSEPWTDTLFRQELSFPLSNCRTASTAEGEIVGYSVFWIIGDEVHLHTIAVKEDQRRQGVAPVLMSDMIKWARQCGARRATLEVRPSNTWARKLYDKFGFQVRGIRPLYYAATGEDALVMWAELGEKDDE